MDSIFLDTSFIIALEDADDQNHRKALVSWKAFEKNPKKLLTTTYVFDEVITFLTKRMDHHKASEVGKLLHGKKVSILSNDHPINDDATDNLFINLAIDGDAGIIVSGDSHLLKLKRYEGIEIVTVSEFLKRKR